MAMLLFLLCLNFSLAFCPDASKVNAGNNTIWPEMSTVDPVLSLNGVMDYKPWTEYGGAKTPVKSTDSRRTFIWFVPDWSNVWGGGHYTLFRFANHFGKSDTRNIIYIYNNERHSSLINFRASWIMQSRIVVWKLLLIRNYCQNVLRPSRPPGNQLMMYGLSHLRIKILFYARLRKPVLCIRHGINAG